MVTLINGSEDVLTTAKNIENNLQVVRLLKLMTKTQLKRKN